MKKLLLASIIMMGFSAVAAAQTSEAAKAKKTEARKQAAQPTFSTAAGETTTAPSAVAADKAKAETEANTEKNAVAAPKVAEVKKTAKPAAKKTKQS